MFCSIGALCLFMVMPLVSKADVNCTKSNQAFSADSCSLARGKHGQWVRGSANLKSDGVLEMRLGLETDSTGFGVKGRVDFDLLDASGKVLLHGVGSEGSIGGKKPGHAKVWWSPWVKRPIDPNIASKVTSIRVSAVVTDNSPLAPFGFNADPMKIQITFPI